MKILVKKGMVSYKKKLYKKFQIIEVDEAAARRFAALGVAEMLPQNSAEPETAAPAEPEQPQTDTADADDDAEEEIVADLPPIDPTAGVKKGGKKGGKK